MMSVTLVVGDPELAAKMSSHEGLG